MTISAMDWSPLGILDRPALRETVSREVEAWSRAWFSSQRFAITYWKLAQADHVDDSCGGGWTTPGQWVGVSCSWRASRRLAEHALDVRLGEEKVTQDDERVLAAFETKMIKDLSDRLEAAFSDPTVSQDSDLEPTPPFEGAGGVVVGLAVAGAPTLMSISIPLAKVAAFCRASIPPPPHRQVALESRRRAILGEPIHLDVILGQVEISIPEIRALVAGDVLVLDQGLDDFVNIASVKSKTRIAQARFTERDGAKAVALVSQT